jgi:hypothetical protein
MGGRGRGLIRWDCADMVIGYWGPGQVSGRMVNKMVWKGVERHGIFVSIRRHSLFRGSGPGDLLGETLRRHDINISKRHRA